MPPRPPQNRQGITVGLWVKAEREGGFGGEEGEKGLSTFTASLAAQTGFAPEPAYSLAGPAGDDGGGRAPP